MWKLNAPENIELEFPVPEDISENKTPPQKQGHQQEEHKEGRLPERFITSRRISSQTTMSHREHH
ncbi:hypothetical protein DPMN_143651 [Dreissena polymorpha]|uniref:Uncharacterized protein n=1 Tax=Dreissena polymorpha TaxID=45954 RepID=A0A9D4GHG9_DREPO|nr:hypothetical protein DPMN_143651 [Dreissena polymorpha]